MNKIYTTSEETLASFTDLNTLEFNHKINKSDNFFIRDYRHLISIETSDSKYLKDVTHSLIVIDMTQDDSPKFASDLLRLSTALMTL